MALSLGVSPSLADEPRPCSDMMFSVDSENAALKEQLCDLAPFIRDKLDSCGLIQNRPLVLEVVDGLSHKLGNCLAWFDCDHVSIRLTDPARYGDFIESDSPYDALPAQVLLSNALTHEMAHALIAQSVEDLTISLVDHEYIAAALELELMDPEWRDVLISAAPVSLPPKVGLIDIWIYGLEPRKFATNAWQHFSLPGNGCELVQQIVRGEASLSGSSR